VQSTAVAAKHGGGGKAAEKAVKTDFVKAEGFDRRVKRGS